MVFKFARAALLSLAVVCAATGGAAAQMTPEVKAKAEAEAQTLIDGCWAISQEKRDSGVTGTMRDGTADTVGCLERTILDQVEILFDPQILTREIAQERLDMIQEGYQKLYWDLANNNRGCPHGWCGTIHQLRHVWEHAKLLEKMVRDFVMTKYQYDIDPKPPTGK